jgi:hypothetical protein
MTRRRPPPATNEMIETTADARRRGLLNQDYNLNVNPKNIFTSEETVRKDCKLLIIIKIRKLCFAFFFS